MKRKAVNMRFLTIQMMLIAMLLLALGGALLGLTSSANYVALAEYNPIRMELRGAKVRIDGNAGIKFYARMDVEAYEACEAEDKQIGFVVGYASDIDGALTVGAENTHSVVARQEGGTSDYALYAAEVNGEVMPLHYGKQMTARGYFYDGETYTYTDDTLSRSMSYIASAALANGENAKSLIDYVDGAIGDSELTIVGGDNELKADETRRLSVQSAAEDELVPVWISNDEKIATIDEKGNLTVLKGSTDEIVVTAVLGSKQAELRFSALARYTTTYFYENAYGEYEANPSFTNVDYAKPGELVQANTGDSYLRDGGFTLHSGHVAYKADAEVADDNSTAMKVYYTQTALTGDGQLTDSNNGAWQVTANYNGNPTKPVRIVKDSGVTDDGKEYSTAIDWQGGYYTELTFNAKNSIDDYTKYNAVAFSMRNDATADRSLYVYSVRPDGTTSQAAPTGKQGLSWGYYVLPLAETVDSLEDVRILVKFSVGYTVGYEGTGKTYFGDFKLINYETPENTLIDFGYSPTALGAATYHGDMAGSKAFVAGGIEDPVTGGSTLQIQDPAYTGGGSGLVYMDGYSFHLGQTQNAAQGNELAYNRLKAVMAAKGDATGVKINFRVYVGAEPRGYKGFWIRPFDITKDWVWIPARTTEQGGTGAIAGQWTDVEFVMTELPQTGDCRFVITICGDKDSEGNPVAPQSGGGVGGQWYAQMAKICVSTVTYEYV